MNSFVDIIKELNGVMRLAYKEPAYMNTTDYSMKPRKPKSVGPNKEDLKADAKLKNIFQNPNHWCENCGTKNVPLDFAHLNEATGEFGDPRGADRSYLGQSVRHLTHASDLDNRAHVCQGCHGKIHTTPVEERHVFHHTSLPNVNAVMRSDTIDYFDKYLYRKFKPVKQLLDKLIVEEQAKSSPDEKTLRLLTRDRKRYNKTLLEIARGLKGTKQVHPRTGKVLRMIKSIIEGDQYRPKKNEEVMEDVYVDELHDRLNRPSRSRWGDEQNWSIKDLARDKTRDFKRKLGETYEKHDVFSGRKQVPPDKKHLLNQLKSFIVKFERDYEPDDFLEPVPASSLHNQPVMDTSNTAVNPFDEDEYGKMGEAYVEEMATPAQQDVASPKDVKGYRQTVHRNSPEEIQRTLNKITGEDIPYAKSLVKSIDSFIRKFDTAGLPHEGTAKYKPQNDARASLNNKLAPHEMSNRPKQEVNPHKAPPMLFDGPHKDDADHTVPYRVPVDKTHAFKYRGRTYDASRMTPEEISDILAEMEQQI